MNKIAVITGASRGIGESIARLLAQSGYKVLINYINSEIKALNLAEEIKSKGFAAEVYRADVSVRSEVNAMLDFCVKKLGKPHILINNAGIAQSKPFADITANEWQEMLDTNLTGAFNCCQSVLKYMLEAKCGKIINISSIWGMVGASCEVHYSAAKAGVIGLTKALAKELAPSGIQVNCIAPGIIDTDMLGDLSDDEIEALKKETPLGRIGSPLDIASSVLYLADDKNSFITGQVISPNGGYVV